MAPAPARPAPAVLSPLWGDVPRRPVVYRRIAAAVMLLSAFLVVGLGVLATGYRLKAPRPVDRSVMFCGPRPGLAEPFHACRNENVLVDL